MNMTSNCDVIKTAHHKQMTIICHWTNPPHENFWRTPLVPASKKVGNLWFNITWQGRYAYLRVSSCHVKNPDGKAYPAYFEYLWFFRPSGCFLVCSVDWLQSCQFSSYYHFCLSTANRQLLQAKLKPLFSTPKNEIPNFPMCSRCFSSHWNLSLNLNPLSLRVLYLGRANHSWEPARFFCHQFCKIIS